MAEELPEAIKPLYDAVVQRLNRELTEVEQRTVEMLCWSAHVHQSAMKTIAETGLLVKSPRGAIIHPLVKVAKDEAETFIKLSNQLNLKPTQGGESFDLWDKLASELMR
jgi:phage terminase small subunit